MPEIDGNSFAHNNGKNGGFKGEVNYFLTDAHYKKLEKYALVDKIIDAAINAINPSSIPTSYLKKKMNADWTGSCFGVAATMALNYNGNIDIPALSKQGKTTYYNMEFPCENKDFLSTINYYQIASELRLLKNKSISCTNAPGYTFNIFSKDIKITLQNIVEYTKNSNIPYVLGYGYWNEREQENGGHSIVLCSSRYDNINKEYHVYFYDENLCKSGVITISDDYSEFSFIDGSGHSIGNKDGYQYNYIQLIDIVNFCDSPFDETTGSGGGGGSAYSSRLKTATAETEEKIFLTFDSNNYFEITDSEGKSLIYTADKAESSIEIYDLTPVETGINSYGYTFSISYSDTYTIRILSDEMSIDMYNGNHFFSVEGNGIEQTEISLKDNEIKLDGKEYDFCAFIETDSKLSNDENGLVSISDRAKGKSSINAHNGNVTVETDELLSNIEVSSYIATDVENIYLKPDDILEVSIDKNGQLESSNKTEPINQVVLGDVNDDGMIDAVDATAVPIAAL